MSDRELENADTDLENAGTYREMTFEEVNFDNTVDLQVIQSRWFEKYILRRNQREELAAENGEYSLDTSVVTQGNSSASQELVEQGNEDAPRLIVRVPRLIGTNAYNGRKVCPEVNCNRHYKESRSLNRHIASMHDTPHGFSEVVMDYFRAKNLTVKPCTECRRKFVYQPCLDRHMMSHGGENTFTCPEPGCDRSFSLLHNMRRHQRGHRGAR